MNRVSPHGAQGHDYMSAPRPSSRPLLFCKSFLRASTRQSHSQNPNVRLPLHQ